VETSKKTGAHLSQNNFLKKPMNVTWLDQPKHWPRSIRHFALVISPGFWIKLKIRLFFTPPDSHGPVLPPRMADCLFVFETSGCYIFGAHTDTTYLSVFHHDPKTPHCSPA
jgi:hypothetical protein